MSGPARIRAKARAARRRYELLAQVTAADREMAAAFPVGVGYGRRGAERRLEQSIDRAVRTERARRDAEYWESRAAALDREGLHREASHTASPTRKGYRLYLDPITGATVWGPK